MAVSACDSCGVEQSAESAKSDRETRVKERFHKNLRTISESLNYELLLMLFCEADILIPEEGQFLLDSTLKNEEKVFQVCQKLKENSYCTLLDCLKEDDEHLGHIYICDLLEGKQHATEKEIAYSKAVKKAVRKNMRTFNNGININELVPHMIENRLLTSAEEEQFYNSKEAKVQQVQSLLRVLATKGPLGYSLFAKCLQNEKSHRTHGELYELIHKSIDPSLIPLKEGLHEHSNTERDCVVMRHEYQESTVTTLGFTITPSRISLQGVLTGTEYDQMIQTFQMCQYNGAWADMETEASKYLKEGVPCELQITAMLEKAMGLIFLKREQESYTLITEAQEKCKEVQGENSTFLQGRSKYVMSVLYRYSKQYDKAREHAQNALLTLSAVERGHDTAFASLIYAALLVVSNGCKIKATTHLRAAISDAKRHSTGTNLVIPHSFMRLAQILIESVQSSPPDSNSVHTIREAESCLKNVELDSLSVRSMCRFHLVQSSLYQCKDMIPESKMAAQSCLDLAVRHQYTNQIEAARDILSKF